MLPNRHQDIIDEEIHLLQLIYPDIEMTGNGIGHIDIPIMLQNKINISTTIKNVIQEYSLSYLPSVRFEFSLKGGYPYDEPPIISVKSVALTLKAVADLTEELINIWNNYKDQVIFSMIDHLQYVLPELVLSSYIQLIALLDPTIYTLFVLSDRAGFQHEFEIETFTCQICQEDFKGSKCTRFESCSHVFCNTCLGDYFKSVITTGEVNKVHCPDFECTKAYTSEREKIESEGIDNLEFKEFKNKLLQQPIDSNFLKLVLTSRYTQEDTEATIARYEELFKNKQFGIIAKHFDHRLVECPRPSCGARNIRDSLDDDLVRCSKCYVAFCFWCGKSWHGNRVKCSFEPVSSLYKGIPVDDLELWIDSKPESEDRRKLEIFHGRKNIRSMADVYTMDKLFKEAVESESSGFQSCPSCNTVIEKSDGCNKMKCTTCKTLFCFLCGYILAANDPYLHYNIPGPCYGMLFHGMEGVEDP